MSMEIRGHMTIRYSGTIGRELYPKFSGDYLTKATTHSYAHGADAQITPPGFSRYVFDNTGLKIRH